MGASSNRRIRGTHLLPGTGRTSGATRYSSPRRGRRGASSIRRIQSTHQLPGAGRPSGDTPAKLPTRGTASLDGDDPVKKSLSFAKEGTEQREPVRGAHTGLPRTHKHRSPDFHPKEVGIADILVWGLEKKSTQEARAQVNKICREAGTTVTTVKTCDQRNGVRRFDVYLDSGTSIAARTKAYRALRKAMSLIGGRALRNLDHEARKKRPVRVSKRVQAPKPDSKRIKRGEGLSLATWNVQKMGSDESSMSAAGKRTCVLAWVSRRRPDVLLLQETGTDAEHALKIPGYTGYHSRYDKSTQGSHGVSTYVKNHLLARTFVEASHWDVSVSIEPKDESAITVMNVYCPSKGQANRKARLLAQKRVKSLSTRFKTQHPGGCFVAGGDWNEKTKELDRRIDTANGDLVRLRFAPNEKGFTRSVSQTYKTGARKGKSRLVNSAIDYFLMSKGHAKQAQRQTTVDEDEFGVSDHLPVEVTIRVQPVVIKPAKAGIKVDREALKDPVIAAKIRQDPRWTKLACSFLELDPASASERSKRKARKRINKANKLAGRRGTSRRGRKITKLNGDAEAFEKTAIDVLRDCGAIKKPARKKWKSRIPLPVIELIAKRKSFGQELRQALLQKKPTKDVVKIRTSMKKTTKKIGKLHRKHKKKEWIKFVRQGTKLAETDSRRFYAFLSVVLGRGHKKPKTGAVWVSMGDGKRRVETDPDKVLAEYRRYLAKARGDPDGTSKPKPGSEEEKRWSDLFALREQQGYRLERLPAVNQDMTLAEITREVQRMRKMKATGHEGLPAELYQMVFPALSKEEEDDAQIANDLQEAVYHLMVTSWLLGHTPTSWATAIVTMLYKKGDEKEVSNYRTINLIPVLAKITSTIVWSRVEKQLVTKDRYSQAQAGFMAGQEGIGQVIALREACLRRRLQNLRTWLLFTDFATAFPKMKHFPMLGKLEEQGVRGRTLRFIKANYRSPKGRIRLAGELSEAFEALRGSLEGCPKSPGCFKNFINDILDELIALKLGCKIPAGKDSYVSETEDAAEIFLYLVGLLFADDKVLILHSKAAMVTAASVIIKWKNTWGMEYGVIKCATMCVPALGDEIFNKKVVKSRKLVKGKWRVKHEKHKDGSIVTVPWTREMQELVDDPIKFEGVEVPVCGEYTYLGINVHFTTALWPACMAKVKLVVSRRNKMAQFIANKSIPPFARAVGITSMLLPVATHGAELLGCPITKDPTIPDSVLYADGRPINRQVEGQAELQAEIDVALRLMFRGRAGTSSGMMSIEVLRAELRIKDLSVLMAKQRVRYSVKTSSAAKTPIARIMSQKLQPKKPSDMVPPQMVKRLCLQQATGQYLRTLRAFNTEPKGVARIKAAGLQPVRFGEIEDQECTKARRFANLVSNADQVRAEANRLHSGSKGYTRYHRAGAARTAKLMSSSKWAKVQGCGTHWLARARVGGWYTARTARAFTPHLKKDYGGCPSCGKVLDTFTHFLGGCAFFEKIRDKQLQPSRLILHLKQIARGIGEMRNRQRQHLQKRINDPSTWVPLLMGETITVDIGPKKKVEINFIELCMLTDKKIKRSKRRVRAVTDLLKHQRRLSRYMGKAMGYRNGHLWTAYPEDRSGRFTVKSKREEEKRERKAKRAKAAADRKKKRLQAAHPRRRKLLRVAKLVVNRRRMLNGH